MPADKPTNLLKEDDEKLFSAGACHIFARELIDLFPDLNYELCCMEAEQWNHSPSSGAQLFSNKKLVHVYAKSGDQLIDIYGVRPLEKYLEGYRTTNRGGSGLCTYSHETYTRNCSLEELFTHSLHEEETGPMNKDRLYLDEDFVAEATARARKIITSHPSQFSVLSAKNPTSSPCPAVHL